MRSNKYDRTGKRQLKTNGRGNPVEQLIPILTEDYNCRVNRPGIASPSHD
jgi:hypothetical protein